jgi:NAD(P)H-dependent flavin oxidoreductase YrpB (nitropropane dioxygenase family)
MASGWKNARQLAFMANAFKAIRIATEDGDIKKGVLPVGQVTGLMRDIPSVAEVIERTVREAESIAVDLAQKAGGAVKKSSPVAPKTRAPRAPRKSEPKK